MSADIHTSRTVPLTVKRFAYSLYAILFLCVSMFLVVLPATYLYFLIGPVTEKKRRRLHRFICRASRFVVQRVPGTRFVLNNQVGERFDKPAVILSNHQSHLDLMCLLMLSPRLVVLTNDWVHRNPIYGLVIRRAEFYTVSDGIEANLDRLADLVRRGYSIVVFPEGTRSPDCRILRFHRGAFYLAEKLGLDLLPVFLHGVGHVLPKQDFMLREGEMYTEIGRRITPDDPAWGADFKARTSAVRKLYLRHYAEICEWREGADYYAWYVIEKYRTAGCGARRACRRLLRRNANFREVIDQRVEAAAVCVERAGAGEFALLYALVHPQVEVHTIESDPRLRRRACRALSLPRNLHLHAAEEELPGGISIWYRLIGVEEAAKPAAGSVEDVAAERNEKRAEEKAKGPAEAKITKGENPEKEPEAGAGKRPEEAPGENTIERPEEAPGKSAGKRPEAGVKIINVVVR